MAKARKKAQRIHSKPKAAKKKKSIRKAPKRSTVRDTFEAWIENEAKKKHGSKEGKLEKAKQMPSDSMAEWLRKQPVVEQEPKEHLPAPLGSTEEWLRNQQFVEHEQQEHLQAPIGSIELWLQNQVKTRLATEQSKTSAIVKEIATSAGSAASEDAT
ncbi:MAG: hypothetical protein JRN15_16175 [Nitrososphaerota archaeon]|nr:hypothetical protein [Nitrososphaerota archaeon]